MSVGPSVGPSVRRSVPILLYAHFFWQFYLATDYDATPHAAGWCRVYGLVFNPRAKVGTNEDNNANTDDDVWANEDF